MPVWFIQQLLAAVHEVEACWMKSKNKAYPFHASDNLVLIVMARFSKPWNKIADGLGVSFPHSYFILWLQNILLPRNNTCPNGRWSMTKSKLFAKIRAKRCFEQSTATGRLQPIRSMSSGLMVQQFHDCNTLFPENKYNEADSFDH